MMIRFRRQLQLHIYAVLACFMLGIASHAYALPDSSPIPAEQAFHLNASLSAPQTLTLTWQIAKGYHLYRYHFRFDYLTPTKTILMPLSWPATTRLPIETLGNPEVYSGQLALIFHLVQPTGKQRIAIDYQGCSDSGFCYPPFKQIINVDPEAYPAVTLSTPAPMSESADTEPSAFWIPNLNQTHTLWALLGFYALGLLLAFTPCVLPMLPILASIIMGQTQNEKQHRGRIAFSLSLTYVLAMAITYAMAGLILAWLGANIQVWLQQTWLLLTFGGLLVILALAQWEFFEIRLPHSWQHKLHQWHHRRRGGSYLEVAIMGVLATLIVSPCVTPPLIATLAYISQVGNFVLGGLALFILALGMGTPLILVGTFEGALLPKAGPWLEGVKILLGLLLLIVAGLVLSRLLSTPWLMTWWSIVAFLLAWKLVKTPFIQRPAIRYSFAALLVIYGLLLLSGVLLQRPHWWGPFGSTKATTTLVFAKVISLDDLNQQRLQAKLLHQPILLDFYAKWCLSCQLMDKTTFADPKVINALQGYRLLRVDMTQQTPAINAILQAYQVYAPPQIILFSADGQQQMPTPLVGEITAKQLLTAITQKPIALCAQKALFQTTTCGPS